MNLWNCPMNSSRLLYLRHPVPTVFGVGRYWWWIPHVMNRIKGFICLFTAVSSEIQSATQFSWKDFFKTICSRWPEMKYLVIVIIYARLLTQSVCSYVCLLRSKHTKRAIIPIAVNHTAFLCSDFPSGILYSEQQLLLSSKIPFPFTLFFFPLRLLTRSGKISGYGDGVAQGERECTPSEQTSAVSSFSDFTGDLVLSLSCLHAKRPLSNSRA